MLRGIKTLCSIRSARIYRKSRKTKLKALKIRYFTEQIFLEDEIKADLNDEEQFEDFSKTIVDLCLQKKKDFRETPLFYKLKYCPTCPPHNDKNSNLYKLIIWKSSGGFYCHRCNNKGGYMKFRAMMDREPTYTKITRNLLEDEKKKKFAMKSKSEELRPKMLQILEKARLSEKNKNFFEQILEKRGITKETLKKFNSGVIHWSFYTDDGFKRKPAIVFPWYVTNTNYSTKVLQRIKRT
ncbi:hypothetical protein MHBO_003226 [Bonamia ostreae]|uniref:DNA primase n=1 Tax=Bonamia ostreae TaxID=126728 RepID=A0ABV2AQQ9_9EUKA